MSVTTVTRTTSLTAATIYVAYGTRENADADLLRAERLSTIGFRAASPLEWAVAGCQELRGHPRRTNQAVAYVQSWPREELDRNDPEHVSRAHQAGLELAHRMAPGCPVTVATHTDSASGCVHNHIVILNHDVGTGLAAPKPAGNVHAVRAVNDEIMRDFGLAVLPGREEVSLSRAERIAQAQGRQIDAAGLSLHELTGDTWRSYLRARIDAVLADEHVGSVDDFIRHGPDHGVHVERQGDALTYALVDDDEDVVRYRTKRGFRKCATSGSRLGSDYTTAGVASYLDDLAQARAEEAVEGLRQQQQRAALAAVSKHTKNDQGVISMPQNPRRQPQHSELTETRVHSLITDRLEPVVETIQESPTRQELESSLSEIDTRIQKLGVSYQALNGLSEQQQKLERQLSVLSRTTVGTEEYNHAQQKVSETISSMVRMISGLGPSLAEIKQLLAELLRMYRATLEMGKHPVQLSEKSSDSISAGLARQLSETLSQSFKPLVSDISNEIRDDVTGAIKRTLVNEHQQLANDVQRLQAENKDLHKTLETAADQARRQSRVTVWALTGTIAILASLMSIGALGKSLLDILGVTQGIPALWAHVWAAEGFWPTTGWLFVTILTLGVVLGGLGWLVHIGWGIVRGIEERRRW
ncbi:relaxase/mobilization nuclease domain-containing protein [Corynebacterium heidelbergense]|uniref:MobA/VirD2-like nuclease domain-containing protein n=1 Tax=Corynebacterium heidelbergense TaxID=2055947 RepID=A0A364VDP6_9CORY|nr:relaxase/mobilization nuclease domain-containing protein [Corynebacterium heidelbergense]RAV34769.1 hypothetical protein CWC39_01615 [Corynebacterium heidelbergense]WCZ37034.1 Relaxase/Mobilization nuclease domain protein [Corynebacterium heidelbergense]